MLTGEVATDIPAPAADVYARLADVAAYPTWQSFVAAAEVREHDAQDRPVVVASRLDAKVTVLKAVLRYAYAEDEVSWTYVEGDLNDMSGRFHVAGEPGGPTRVHMQVRVDPGFRLGLLLRGPAEAKVRNRVLDGTLRDLAASFA